MQVHSVTNQNNHKSFKAVRYQNGIKTKAALSANIKDKLSLLEGKCNGIKNVDLILTDKGGIQLDVKTPRYLSQEFKRFYQEKDCETDYTDNQMTRLRIKDDPADIYFLPTKDIGIYDIKETYETNNFNIFLKKVLTGMSLIDTVSENIRSKEEEYGMNCVNVLENVEKYAEESKRMVRLDNINNAYYIPDSKLLEQLPDNWLNILECYEDDVSRLKHYGVAVMEEDKSGGRFVNPFLNDKKGYLNDSYKPFYEKMGYNIIQEGESVVVMPKNNQYTQFVLYPVKDKNSDFTAYGVWLNGYEISSVLTTFGRKEKLDDLVWLANELDKIGNAIEKYGNEL